MKRDDVTKATRSRCTGPALRDEILSARSSGLQFSPRKVTLFLFLSFSLSFTLLLSFFIHLLQKNKSAQPRTQMTLKSNGDCSHFGLFTVSLCILQKTTYFDRPKTTTSRIRSPDRNLVSKVIERRKKNNPNSPILPVPSNFFFTNQKCFQFSKKNISFHKKFFLVFMRLLIKSRFLKKFSLKTIFFQTFVSIKRKSFFLFRIKIIRYYLKISQFLVLSVIFEVISNKYESYLCL